MVSSFRFVIKEIFENDTKWLAFIALVFFTLLSMVYVCNITIVDNKTNHSNPLSYKTINFSTFYTLFFKFDTVKKLRDAAIFSLQQLRSTTSKTLLSIKGFSDAKVNKIIDAAKKKIEWNSFVNATDILAKQSAAVPISTGSSDLDELLGGGIQTGYLTEIYGEAGAGKTQLMFTLAINAMTSDDPGRVCWIDTEGAFSAERIREIAAAKGFEDPSEALENVAVMNAVNHELQMQAPACVYALIDQSDAPYKLIVIDSIISTFRAEFNGRGELSDSSSVWQHFVWFAKEIESRNKSWKSVQNNWLDDNHYLLSLLTEKVLW